MATMSTISRTVSRASADSGDSDNGPRLRSRPASQRVSMEDYYQSHLTNVSRRQSAIADNFDDPPTYDVAINGLHLPPMRLKIQPREDEGREQLPAYSCSIMMRAVFERKMELETAVHRAFDRNWHKVFVELQGTALRFYKTKSAGMFADGGGPNSSADLPPYLKPGELLKMYSLQHADVGIAADYKKRPYVIRIRVETDQLLLSCVEIETFLLWVHNLTAAIDLAPPLEERKLPRDTSMPFRNRRGRTPTETIPEETTAPPSRAEMRNFSDDAAETNSLRPSVASIAMQDMLLLGPEEANRLRDRQVSSQTTSNTTTATEQLQASAIVPRPIRPPQSNFFPSNPSQPNPNIGPNGKWRPVHDWSPRYDMIYAKRCMAVLLSNTPRKTNLVIMRGKQWIVDWATGKLTRWEPPAYDPPAYVELVGPWGVFGATGSYLRT